MTFNYTIQAIAPLVQKVWSEMSTDTVAQSQPWSFLGFNADQCFFLGFFILSILVCGIYVITVQAYFQKHNKSIEYHKKLNKFIN